METLPINLIVVITQTLFSIVNITYIFPDYFILP